MHECLLCERDMKKSKSTFGNGCINNIFTFLNIEKPRRCKNKEQLLYKNIMKITNVSKINNNQKIWLTDRYLTYQYLNQLHYGNFENLKKHKSQYDRNSLKAMQYAFWQTVIELGGRYFNYELAAELLQHSLEKEPTDFLISDEEFIELIVKDENFKNKINEIINKHKKEKEIYIPIGQEYVAFENSDLYFAIHNANIKMEAQQDSNLDWNIEITLSDTFDFTKWKAPLEYYFDANNIPKSILSSTLYNLAFISQKLGVIKEYDVIAELTIKVQKNGEIQKL